MHIDCTCGFSGSIRPIPVGSLVYGRCFGCNKKYEQKGQQVSEVKDIPEFKTWEEVNQFLMLENGPTKYPGGEKKASTGSKKRANRTKQTKPSLDGAANLVTSSTTKPENIYQTIHYYVRQEDAWQAVLVDAKEERGYRNENVLVFAHNHQLGETCTNLCRTLNKEQSPKNE